MMRLRVGLPSTRGQAVHDHAHRRTSRHSRRLYRELGVAAGRAARRARLAYAVSVGIGRVRRADPDGDLSGRELKAYPELAIDVMIPPPGPIE